MSSFSMSRIRETNRLTHIAQLKAAGIPDVVTDPKGDIVVSCGNSRQMML